MPLLKTKFSAQCINSLKPRKFRTHSLSTVVRINFPSDNNMDVCSLQTFKTFLLYTEHEIRRSSLNERVIAIIPRLQLCIQHSQTILQSLL